MKSYKLEEIRHLRPHLRLALLEGRVRYRGQEKPIEVEDEHVQKLRHSGQLAERGGQSAAANDPRLYVGDTLIRSPNIASPK